MQLKIAKSACRQNVEIQFVAANDSYPIWQLLGRTTAASDRSTSATRSHQLPSSLSNAVVDTSHRHWRPFAVHC